MSVIKSQIHDGFATIRTRGLHRSRSRTEQLEKLKPIIVTTTTACIHNQMSAPVTPQPPSLLLYENNNDLYYNFKNPAPSPPPPPPTPPVAKHHNHQFSTLSTSCNSFKRSFSSGLSGGGGEDDFTKITPPISPTTPPPPTIVADTPDLSVTSKSFADYFPYTRPESPAYGQIKLHDDIEMYKLPINGSGGHHQPAASGPTPPSRVFTPTYYRKDSDTLDYALTKMVSAPAPPAFPAMKSHSLHYRKSYSHPAKTIYEDGNNSSRNSSSRLDSTAAGTGSVHRYYSSISNYYSPSEISDHLSGSGRVSTLSADLGSDRGSTATGSSKPVPVKFIGYEKRFATLSYPKESQRLRPQQRFSTSHISDGSGAGSATATSHTDLEYFDPLDCKIGCQTTLRSKPRIPWYELAIKKDIRRQSCPPNNEVNILFLLNLFYWSVYFQ